MCLWCAVPVRGVAYGPECLGIVLGEQPVDEVERPRRSAPLHVAWAFGVALASTVLPWTTFGEGAGAFGAWGLTPRWALIAAVGSVVGLAIAVIRVRRAEPDARLDAASTVLAVAVTLGAVLEWFRPPFPSRPSIVPWLAAIAGAVAALGSVRSFAEDRRR